MYKMSLSVLTSIYIFAKLLKLTLRIVILQSDFSIYSGVCEKSVCVCNSSSMMSFGSVYHSRSLF